MKIIDVILDIFLDRREDRRITFTPEDLTDHYKKELGQISLDALYRATSYKEIEHSLSRYKYFSERENVDLYVDLLSKIVEKYDLFESENTLIVPVPMHWSRYILRGFDHTALLAKHLSKKTGIPMKNLLRAKWTRHQSKLSREKRLENKKNSFRMKDLAFREKNIILIDDVVSSGSTADECARVLKNAGAKKVIGIFLASNL